MYPAGCASICESMVRRSLVTLEVACEKCAKVGYAAYLAFLDYRSILPPGSIFAKHKCKSGVCRALGISGFALDFHPGAGVHEVRVRDRIITPVLSCSARDSASFGEIPGFSGAKSGIFG